MEITTAVNQGILEVTVAGRLDGYWADHLNEALADVVRDGHHRVRVDCSGIEFLSSAGIAVLMKYYKQLQHLGGSLQVVNPSKNVAKSLRISRLLDMLSEPGTVVTGTAAQAPARRATRRLDRDGATFDVYDLDVRARLICKAIGNAEPLAAGAFRLEDCRSLESLTPAFALGVGAFGHGFEDCRTRFGELLSVSGATAYQPSGSTNVADYLIVGGALTSDVQLLYGLACDGGFSHLVRFEGQPRGPAIRLSRLLDACFEAVATASMGVVLVAETAGLVGAALRRSPAEPVPDADFFAHPGIRSRLAFTAEPAFAQGVTLAAGVVSRSADGARHSLLRPMGADCVGHLHAAAFRFRPIKKGPIDLRETVAGLFENEQVQGVLHLLHDDRGAAAAGESEFVRGACWIGPITDAWEAA